MKRFFVEEYSGVMPLSSIFGSCHKFPVIYGHHHLHFLMPQPHPKPAPLHNLVSSAASVGSVFQAADSTQPLPEHIVLMRTDRPRSPHPCPLQTSNHRQYMHFNTHLPVDEHAVQEGNILQFVGAAPRVFPPHPPLPLPHNL